MAFLERLVRTVLGKSGATLATDNPVYATCMIPYEKGLAWLASAGIREQQVLDAWGTSILQKVKAIIAADDPIGTTRQHYAESIYSYAPYAVLVMRPPPAQDYTGMRGQHGVTGGLHAHFHDIVRNDEILAGQMAEVIADPNISDDELVIFCERRSLLWYWHIQVLFAARLALKDVEPKTDWHKPFMHAVLAFAESQLRSCIKLPSAIADDEFGFTALAYSTYFNLVVSGERAPDTFWRENYAEEIRAGSLRPYRADALASAQKTDS